MARVMRQVLVDHARALGAAKRGGGEGRVPWDTQIEVMEDRGGQSLKLLELHGALDALTRENRSLAEIVEMHYFGGMTAEETALVVGQSAHKVRHDLRLARAWLRRELAREQPLIVSDFRRRVRAARGPSAPSIGKAPDVVGHSRNWRLLTSAECVRAADL
jgi:DNA-directed RNA polymerase specialized sigma24 family protein